MTFEPPPDPGRLRGLLVLRHLLDGDAIDYPVPDDQPYADDFRQLVALGLVARWDRVWPLHDRYRLTEAGIREIEAYYKPGEAQGVMAEMKRRNLGVAERADYLRTLGRDPYIWPVLHDPGTHWMIWGDDPGSYWRYVWETPPPAGPPRKPAAPGPRSHVEDLDDEADDRGVVSSTTYVSEDIS